MSYLNTGVEPTRWGTAHASIVPYQAFRTRDDEYFIVGGATDQFFAMICDRIGLPQLAKDPRFLANSDRVVNRNVLIELLSERFRQRTLQELLDDFDGASLPYGPVNTFERVFAHPQVLHNEMILDLDHEQYGRVRVMGPPVKMGASSVCHTAPPVLGEHTEQVLAQVLNLDRYRLAELRDLGVIE